MVLPLNLPHVVQNAPVDLGTILHRPMYTHATNLPELCNRTLLVLLPGAFITFHIKSNQ